ncbi:M9 family metallopeptidase [Vibrio proteolyticus]|uniref:microbial collagenase n=1 Tax=Vibrio proteolyticus NBRC 13287 TaxID=1219065 RepID=U2ZY06_VIBPR|nr:M9 family metallopeptidase [Vibrio proteolyticus]GAD65977.1 putative microbial collagenase [Vibrio proteolyticus NBRC 13287]
MELKKLTIAVVAMLAGTHAWAASAPTPQHKPLNLEHHHGVETHQDDRAPTRQTMQPPQKAQSLLRSMSAEATVECDVSAFATSDTNQLISEIRTQGSQCVNELFGADSATQVSAFDSNNMYQVAKYTTQLAKNYPGGGSSELEALFLYLRAGFYAEFYNDGVTLASWVTTAVKESVDAFVASPHFYDSNDAHGKVLGEVIITMDSAELQHEYLDVVTQWLTRWNSDYAQHWYMRNAVNGIFTILYRGQWNNQFVAQIGKQTQLVEALSQFALNQSMVGSDSEFMLANAGKELGRLTMYSNTSIQPLVKQKLTQLFDQYPMYGSGDAVWLGAADVVSYYADCSDYGICGFETQLKAQVLAQSYTCSPTIRILSQDLTAIQQQAACDKMGFEEGYFHTTLETGNQPVADDHNTQLQVNIFNSSEDYGKYAGPIFGIDTNNGGMYLEGDPSQPGNVPNFIAYEASYANPDHYIWNLEHEYVHYLDGRFDMYGDFSAPTEKVVWWSEGVAEYVSKEKDNQAALDTIEDGSVYTLSEIFDTTYDGFDVDRIYRWGYLAVRFMFERHPDEVNLMLAETRAGNWSGYKTIIDQWAVQYQGEFEQWTTQLVNGSSLPGCDGQPTVSGGRVTVGEPVCLASQDVIWLSIEAVNAGQSIAITTGQGSGDLKLEYSNQGWPDGSNVDASSDNSGNQECIVVNSQSNYWGYLKISGAFSGAALAVDFDATSCR